MAYNKQEMIEQCLKVIEENQVITKIQYIFPSVPFCSATFYNHGLEKMESIKKALEVNRLKEKLFIFNKLRENKNVLGLIAYLKLIADPEEYDRLNTQKLDHSNKGEKFDFNPMSDDEFASKINEYLSATAKGGD